MLSFARHLPKALAAATAVPIALLGSAAASGAPVSAAGHAQHLRVRQILFGARLTHTFRPTRSATPRTEPLTQPDDITMLDGRLFTGFQNGVGSQGEASKDGNLDSTVVEFTFSGHVVRTWDVRGKVDGLGAQRQRHRIIATVNEDAHSSVYTITPGAAPGRRVEHYRYDIPLPHNGGTDSVSTYHGRVLISASAPGTTGPAAPRPFYPAVFRVTFSQGRHVATVRPVFFDEAPARVANVGSAARGKTVHLALTDPDSNEVVPRGAGRFAGDFMLSSQADKEQIYLRQNGRGVAHRHAVLRLSQAVDDTAWQSGRFGSLFAADAAADTVDVVTGPFRPGSAFVAVTPCDGARAPAVCPAPPSFPDNFLGSLNPWTGHIAPVRLRGPVLNPKGLVFVPRR